MIKGIFDEAYQLSKELGGTEDDHFIVGLCAVSRAGIEFGKGQAVKLASSDLKRRIYNLEMAVFGRSGNNGWHSTGKLATGENTGKVGAMTHLTDSEGFPISKGYHDIEREHGFHYIGSTGAHEEEIQVDVGSIERKKF